VFRVSNLAAFFPVLETVPRVREPVFRIEAGGRWQPFLQLASCEQRAGGVPRVELQMASGLHIASGSEWLVERSLRLIGPADLVTVDLVRSGALTVRGSGPVRLFEGYIDGPEFAYSADGQRASFAAVDRSESLLGRRLRGQHAATAGGEVTLLSGADLVFNLDGRPTMSADDHVPEGERPRRLFAAPVSDGAEFWTADQAVNYLVAFYAAASWLHLPTMAELTKLFGEERLDNVRLEGRTVMQALEQLGRRVGLRPTVALSRTASGELVRSLVFVGRGFGRTVSLYHQMPGETFTLARTAMASADVSIEWADAPAVLEVSGDVKLYETTFDLKPGWDPALEGQEREAYRRSDNVDFAANADVYRKWVLNEAGDYTGEPVDAGEAHDFSALFGHGDYLVRRRRLLPTVSTDEAGESHGVVVELSYDGGQSYARYRGPVRVLRDECGITLSGDQLPAELFHAAERDKLAVRVTATVESDSRLGVIVERPGLAEDHRGRRLWRDVSDEFHWRHVDAGSIFYGGASREVDDTERLLQLAADLWQAERRAPSPSRIGLPFFSVSYRLGDRIDAVRYRYAWLRRSDDGIETDPTVEGVRQQWSAEDGWRTELALI
jgi:hypothetical protein